MDCCHDRHGMGHMAKPIANTPSSKIFFLATVYVLIRTNTVTKMSFRACCRLEQAAIRAIRVSGRLQPHAQQTSRLFALQSLQGFVSFFSAEGVGKELVMSIAYGRVLHPLQYTGTVLILRISNNALSRQLPLMHI